MSIQHAMVAVENAFYRIDLIGWLDYFHGLFRHGKLRKIAWYDVGGFTIENTLRRYDIHAHGRALQTELEKDGDKWRKVYLRWMWVPEKQAGWAEYLLLRAGITLVSVIDPRNVEWAQRHNGTMPTPWAGGRRAKAATPVEAAFDMFGGMLGLGDEQPVAPRRNRKRTSRPTRSRR